MAERRPAGHANLATRGVHPLGDWMVSFYLVATDDGITVVDAGLPGHYAQFTGALARLGRPVTDVRAVLITHAHPDHTGLAERIRAASGASVWVSPADAPILADPRQIGAHWKAECSLLPYLIRRPATLAVPLHMARHGAFRPRPVAQLTIFEPGQVLDVPGHPLAVAAPGHTRGSTAFVFADLGVICTGDALVTYDGITGLTGPRLVARAFTQDSAASLGSLDILAEHDMPLVLPGHGRAYAGGLADAVDRARQAGIS